MTAWPDAISAATRTAMPKAMSIQSCTARWYGIRLAEDRGLCPGRRLPDRRAGRTQRLDRLAVLAALRFAGVLCRSGRYARERLLEDLPAGEIPVQKNLSPRHADPRNRVRDRRRCGYPDRLHAGAHR